MSDEEISDEEFEAELRGLQKAAREMYPAALRVPAEVSAMHATAVWKAAKFQEVSSRRIEEATKRLGTFTMWLMITTGVLALATNRFRGCHLRRVSARGPFHTEAVDLRLVEIAELLGVSKQRAHQIADEPRFPGPSDATTSAGCGAGERSRRGRRSGAPRSHGARPAGRAGMIDDLDDYIA